MEFSLQITVSCDECGAELYAEHSQKKNAIYVKPCQKCLDEAADEAKEGL